MQSDLDVDFDMPYDPETGDVYDTLSYLDGADSSDFDWNRLADEMNSTAQEVYEYACEVDGTDEDDLYEESWIGDKCRRRLMKESKKSFHGIPDAYLIDTGSYQEPEVEYRGITLEYGDVDDNLWEIYQKDHPEDPEGKDYPSWVKKNPSYVEYVLEELYDKAIEENPEQFDEGMEEDVLDMPDRVDELESEIEKLWVRLGDVDEGTVMKLIAAYVELEQIEPGRVDF